MTPRSVEVVPAVSRALGDVTLLQTDRFGQNYGRYLGLRFNIELRARSAVSDLRGGTAVFLNKRKALQGSPLPLYRVKVTKGDRLLLHWEGRQIVLVDVGPHEVMEIFTSLPVATQRAIIDRASPADRVFLPEYVNSLFESVDGTVLARYDAELIPQVWAQFLDLEQQSVLGDVEQAVADHVAAGQPEMAVHFVLGGAGTGKTTLLLHLAADLPVLLERPVTLRVSTAVRNYLRQVSVLSGLAVNEPATAGGVVLLDDPGSAFEVEKAIAVAREAGAAAFVMAGDPLQWNDKDLAGAYARLGSRGVDQVHTLHTCYRQQGKVATRALDMTRAILERSSWRSDPRRIEAERERLADLKHMCLDSVVLADDAGRAPVYRDNLDLAFANEALRLRLRDDRWETHPLLLLYDGEAGVKLPGRWKAMLEGLGVHIKPLTSSDQVRGVEYQEVFLLLSEHLVDRIDRGDNGLSAVEWKGFMTLHRLFTRAKDSVVTFVIPPHFS